MLKKLLLTAVLVLSLAPVTSQASVIANLGVNPTSAQGAFSNQVGGAIFADQYTFQLTKPETLTIASVTNVFPNTTDFISNFVGQVFLNGNPVPVIGPVAATANCGLDCQGFAGSAVLPAGFYFLDISGTGGGTSGYGGNLSVAAIPEASTWAMMLIGFCAIGLFGMRKKGYRFRVA